MTLLYLVLILMAVALLIAMILLRKYPERANPLTTIFHILLIVIVALLVISIFVGLSAAVGHTTTFKRSSVDLVNKVNWIGW